VTAVPTRASDVPRRLTAGLVAVLAALAAVVLLAGPAAAHAVLLDADPADRSALDTVPEQVTLTFNEPVELPSGGLRVFDADATRIDTGAVSVGGPETIGVGLPADLPDGGYVVTYRVISADSHPVGGALTFTVGDAEEVDDAVVAELFGGAGTGVSGILGPALRGLGYVATLLAVGAAAFAWFVARRDEDRDAARRVGVPAAWTGVALAVVAIPVQAAAVTGGSLAELVSPTVLGEVVGSSFGIATLVRIGALVVLALLWRFGVEPVGVTAVGALALASYLLDGHQRTVEPTWLLVGGDAIHLAAGAVWSGGIVLLAGALRRRRLGDDPAAAAGLVARFSSVALVSVAALTVGGVAMAVPLVGAPAALTSTGYGWTLVAKVALVAVIVLVALYNRQRLVPAITARLTPAGGAVDEVPATDTRVARSEAAWTRLTTTVRVEAVLLVVVLLLTGALVTQRPAAEAAGLSGYYQTTVELTDELDLDLVVDPNRAGLNTLHVYVLDETGRPTADAEDLQLELTYVPEAIGPFVIEPYLAGPGHWTAAIEELAFPGEWEVRIVVGLDRFSETTVTVPVVVGS
jgi:copper transport protein